VLAVNAGLIGPRLNADGKVCRAAKLRVNVSQPATESQQQSSPSRNRVVGQNLSAVHASRTELFRVKLNQAFRPIPRHPYALIDLYSPA